MWKAAHTLLPILVIYLSKSTSCSPSPSSMIGLSRVAFSLRIFVSFYLCSIWPVLKSGPDLLSCICRWRWDTGAWSSITCRSSSWVNTVHRVPFVFLCFYFHNVVHNVVICSVHDLFCQNPACCSYRPSSTSPFILSRLILVRTYFLFCGFS